MLATEEGEACYGLDIPKASGAEWIACAQAFEGLRGPVGVQDMTTLMRVLPSAVRSATLGWRTVQCQTVDAAFGATESPVPALTVEATIAAARAACAFRAQHVVETSVVTPLVAHLNRVPVFLDAEEPARIIARAEGERRAAIEALRPGSDAVGALTELRAVKNKASYADLREDPSWADRYDRFLRADLVVQRAGEFMRLFLEAPQQGPYLVAEPTWRFHRPWSFAASNPALHILMRELRTIVVAPPGYRWISLALAQPRVRYTMAEATEGLTAVEAEDPLVTFARARGFASPALFEQVLSAHGDVFQKAVTAATNEVCTWALRQAVDWPRFEAPLSIWVRGAVFILVPETAPLAPFIQHLHATLLTTPRVAQWRAQGALHWQVGAGLTWGGIKTLSDDQTLWPTELQLL